MGFKGDWQKVKKAFETSTGRSKPAERNFLGIRKSSGIESALDSIDKAKDKAGYTTALGKYETAMTTFAGLCSKEVDVVRKEKPENKDAIIKAFADMRTGIQKLNEAIQKKGTGLGEPREVLQGY